MLGTGKEIGCKFLLAEAPVCQFGQQCGTRRCPYKHLGNNLHITY